MPPRCTPSPSWNPITRVRLRPEAPGCRTSQSPMRRATGCEGLVVIVAATITSTPGHPLGRLLGDALVLVPSASGRSRARRLGFKDEHGLQLTGTHHLALLNHPAVYSQLRRWLA